jgi:hypothetical protein
VAENVIIAPDLSGAVLGVEVLGLFEDRDPACAEQSPETVEPGREARDRCPPQGLAALVCLPLLVVAAVCVRMTSPARCSMWNRAWGARPVVLYLKLGRCTSTPIAVSKHALKHAEAAKWALPKAARLIRASPDRPMVTTLRDRELPQVFNVSEAT